MIDISLNSSGDITFKEVDINSRRLKVDFYKSKSKALKINFYTEFLSIDKPSKNALSINFDIIKNKNNKRVATVSNDMYLIQQSLIRLKTPLGQLTERKEIGSNLEAMMHKPLHLKSTLVELESAVSEAIKPVVGECSVTATPTIIKDEGYKQLARVKVSKNQELLFTYEME